MAASAIVAAKAATTSVLNETMFIKKSEKEKRIKKEVSCIFLYERTRGLFKQNRQFILYFCFTAQ
jgi:hypothetical protein